MKQNQDQFFRIFLAVPIHPSLTPLLTNLIESLKPGIQGRITWVREEHFHLTLKFLGEVKASQLDLIKLLSRKVIETFPSFTLSFGSLDFFPNRKQARVVVVRGSRSFEYERLVSLLNEALFPFGTKEKKEPVPHITLGRIKELRQPIETKVLPLVPIKPFVLKVKEVYLYSSTLNPTGPQYQLLERFYLQ